jgi:hypothetical protein
VNRPDTAVQGRDNVGSLIPCLPGARPAEESSHSFRVNHSRLPRCVMSAPFCVTPIRPDPTESSSQGPVNNAFILPRDSLLFNTFPPTIETAKVAAMDSAFWSFPYGKGVTLSKVPHITEPMALRISRIFKRSVGLRAHVALQRHVRRPNHRIPCRTAAHVHVAAA